MLKKLTSLSLLTVLISGCSSTIENKTETLRSYSGAAIQLYATLEREEDVFSLGNKLYTATPQSLKSTNRLDRNTNIYFFNLATFYPAFESSQFKCGSKCNRFEKMDDPFLGVSYIPVARGDNFRQMLEREKLSIIQYNPFVNQSNVKENAGKVVAGAFLTAISPFVLLGGAAAVANAKLEGKSPNLDFSANNVYFDHVGFTNEVREQILSKYGTYDIFASRISALHELIQMEKNLKHESVTQLDFLNLKLNVVRYADSKLNLYLPEVPKHQFELPEPTTSLSEFLAYERQKLESIYATYNNDINAKYDAYYDTLASEFVDIHTTKKLDDISQFKNAINTLEIISENKLVSPELINNASLNLTKQKQVWAYNQAKTNGSAAVVADFIAEYKNQDVMGLLQEAKDLHSTLVKAEAAIEKKRVLELNAKRAERQRKLQKLNDWRDSLQLGDDTFCGRIIEVNSNSTMYKLALSAKLKGYASEDWVHKSDLYEPWRGCININGVLSPKIKGL